jgi:hypothetical protein
MSNVTGSLIALGIAYTAALIALFYAREPIKAAIAVIVYALTAIYLMISPFVVIGSVVVIALDILQPSLLSEYVPLSRAFEVLIAMLLPLVPTVLLRGRAMYDRAR